MAAWRDKYPEQELTLVRRGTSLGSIDIDAAMQLGIRVANTPGVNSCVCQIRCHRLPCCLSCLSSQASRGTSISHRPHVAKFVVETLGLTAPLLSDPSATKAVVVGAGSVGQSVVSLMQDVGVTPTIVNRSPQSPSLEVALRGASHVAVCAATSGEPIFTAAHVGELLAGGKRSIQICSVSRPEAFSLEAIMMVADHEGGQASLRFDYGDSTLAPTRDKVNQHGVREAITWSSKAMASEACKQDMDDAVLRLLQSSSST